MKAKLQVKINGVSSFDNGTDATAQLILDRLAPHQGAFPKYVNDQLTMEIDYLIDKLKIYEQHAFLPYTSVTYLSHTETNRTQRHELTFQTDSFDIIDFLEVDEKQSVKYIFSLDNRIHFGTTPLNGDVQMILEES
jgi:hypothetical protein